MKTAAIIVAAGRGTRLGAEIPKQYLPVGRVRILTRTLALFLNHPDIDLVQVVIHPDDRILYDASAESLQCPALLPPVLGGTSRVQSVRFGLDALARHAPANVLIHDAARPFCPNEVIGLVVAALSTSSGAFPALPIVDALWRTTDTNTSLTSEDRKMLWRAQTPQGFRYGDICRAHANHTGSVDDDVGIAVANGLEVAIVAGSEQNFKITTSADLERAGQVAGTDMDVRTGNGFDVHAFTEGDAVTLNGIKIPFERSLAGHSDADVGMHAITDAIFGALAEGDIGQWFPPSDQQWKGAASEIFLAKAVERVRERGFSISNLDCTLICERPKIGPHCSAMRQELARICEIEMSRISVKATTSERLGFTGREEGIAAMATVTLVGN